MRSDLKIINQNPKNVSFRGCQPIPGSNPKTAIFTSGIDLGGVTAQKGGGGLFRKVTHFRRRRRRKFLKSDTILAFKEPFFKMTQSRLEN